MAEQLRRASFWTFKSFLLLTNKIITFLFAFFCVVTGQVKSNNVKQETQRNNITIRGKVFSIIDTSLIDNIKIALHDQRKSGTLYGIIHDPVYDTSTIDGSYEIESLPFDPWYTRGQYFVATDIDGETNGSFKTCTLYVSLEEVVSDTIIDIYIVPDNVSKFNKKNIIRDNIEICNTNNLVIKLNNIKNIFGNYIEIYNTNGKLIRGLKVDEKGFVKLDKELFTKGFYIIKIPVDNYLATTKLIIR